MSRTPRALRNAIVALALPALLLGACTSDRGSSDAPATDAAPSEPEAPATAAEVLAAVAALDLPEDERLAYLAERAADEGALVLYTSSEAELTEAWLDAFRAAFPDITVESVSLDNTDIVERVLAEDRAGRPLADVVRTTSPGLAAMLAQDLLAPHSGVSVPDDHPAAYVDPYAVTHRIGPVIIPVLATDDLETAPSSWDDFLEPEHAGCVYSAAPSWVAALVAERGEDGAAEWFEGFLANGGVMADGNNAQVRRLLAGEIDCVVQANAHSVARLIEDDGAPLEMILPERTSATATAVAVHRDTARPHGAALLALWLAGPGGGQVIADFGEVPVSPRVTTIAERLRPWLDPDSAEARRTTVIDLERSVSLEEAAFRLLERYYTPNLVAG